MMNVIIRGYLIRIITLIYVIISDNVWKQMVLCTYSLIAANYEEEI